MDPIKCLFCDEPVEQGHVRGYGTAWIHVDGYRECRATYAAPNFLEMES